MNKKFLYEPPFIVIEYGPKRVSFSSIEEFNKYVPWIDLSEKDYIDYEPNRKVYIDRKLDTHKLGKDVEEVKEYEILFESLDEILSNVNNKYFNMTIEKARTIKIYDIKLECFNIITRKWPLWKQINCINNIYDITVKDEVDNDIELMRKEVERLEDIINSSTSIDEIKNIKLENLIWQ